MCEFWEGGGSGPYRDIQLDDGSVTDIRPLPDGGIITASELPSLRFLERPGKADIIHGPASADLRIITPFLVSSDGASVQFTFEPFGFSPGCFSVSRRTLTGGPCPKANTSTAPKRDYKGKLPYFSYLTGPHFKLDDSVSMPLRENEKVSYAFTPEAHPLCWAPTSAYSAGGLTAPLSGKSLFPRPACECLPKRQMGALPPCWTAPFAGSGWIMAVKSLHCFPTGTASAGCSGHRMGISMQPKAEKNLSATTHQPGNRP